MLRAQRGDGFKRCLGGGWHVRRRVGQRLTHIKSLTTTCALAYSGKHQEPCNQANVRKAFAKSARRSTSDSSPMAKRTTVPRAMCWGQRVRMDASLYGTTRLMGPPQLQPMRNSSNDSQKASTCRWDYAGALTTRVLIVVDTFNASAATFTISATLDLPPLGDVCQQAEPLPLDGGSVAGTTVGYSTDYQGPALEHAACATL